jgi:thiamine-monophosphate kinase
MRITKLGEFGLIERLRKRIKTDSALVIKASGDDCAVLALNKDEYQLFTCDMLVEGIDFSHHEKPYLIGRKSLAVSISDIAACGGSPRYCLISLGLPKETSVEFVDMLFKGMTDIARKFKINIVGGDLSRAEQLTIDVSMLGVVEKESLVLRNGARKGDIIFVTGELGGSISGKHLSFTPRLKEARLLVKNFKVNAMIDISDGLLQDLMHILTENNCGAVLYEALIPLSKKAKNLKDALSWGEDFELLFTMSHSEAKKLLRRKYAYFKPIGEIIEKKYGFKLIDKQGREKNIRAEGFRHF